MSKNYYKILNIKKTATQEEIKSSYRKLAVEKHPDKNLSDPTASDRFKEILEAYEVLSDVDKRKEYDNKTNIPRIDTGFNGINNIFKNFFNITSFFGVNNNKNIYSIEIPLKNIYNGKNATLSIQRKSLCNICEGTGTHDKTDHDCKVCNSKGYIVNIVSFGLFQNKQQQTCPGCNGNKFIGEYIKCYSCNGEKLMDEKYGLELNIEKGYITTDTVSLGNVGDYNLETKIREEIRLNIKVMEDEIFKIRNNDLIINIKISLSDMLYGFKRTITMLDNREINIECNSFIQKNKIIVKDEGLLTDSGKGNLEVIISVDSESIPKKKLWEILNGEKEYIEYKNNENITVV